MILKRPFMFPVYKDQAVALNRGLIVEAGDVVTVLVRNHDGTETTRDLTLTGVEDSGKSILWDTTTASNLRVEDITRVGAEHEYNCPGETEWTLVITETGGGAAALTFNSITIDGVVHLVPVVEDAVAAGISADFRTELIDDLNSLLAGVGYASDGGVTGVAGSQVFTVNLTGMSVWPSAASVTNGSVVLTQV